MFSFAGFPGEKAVMRLLVNFNLELGSSWRDSISAFIALEIKNKYLMCMFYSSAWVMMNRFH